MTYVVSIAYESDLTGEAAISRKCFRTERDAREFYEPIASRYAVGMEQPVKRNRSVVLLGVHLHRSTACDAPMAAEDVATGRAELLEQARELDLSLD